MSTLKKGSKSKYKICTIISHTDHYKKNNNTIVGFGSTVEEIDHLSKLFNTVYHCAPLQRGSPNLSFFEYKSSNIIFIPLNPAGGKTIKSKLMHFQYLFKNFKKIKDCLKVSDILHFRVPAGLGLLYLPWVLFFWKGGTWIKYAGSWNDKMAPLSYKIQRWILKIFPKNVKISINGSFERKRINFFNFINPCFDNNTFSNAEIISKKKQFDRKLRLLFVGRVENAKGFDDLIYLMGNIGNINHIESLTVIGETDERLDYKTFKKNLPIDICFTGAISRYDVFKYYEKSHVIILLSKSEGFPKVIMEAGAFGCVPIISDIDQIKSVIKNSHNGYILDSQLGRFSVNSFKSIISDSKSLKHCSNNISLIAKQFTFENYIKMVCRSILH